MQELKGCCLSSGDLVTLQRSGVALEVGGGVVSKHNAKKKCICAADDRPISPPT